MVKTLVAVYKDPHTAQYVIEALLEAGFSGDDISLLVKGTSSIQASSEISSGDAAGFGALVGALVGIGSALVPGIGPVIGSGLVAVAVTAGIGAAAGALTGGLSAGLLDLEPDDKDSPDSGNRLGGVATVVSVTSNEEWLEWAQRIMARHDPLKIEEREAKWYTGGWTSPPSMSSEGQSMVESESDLPIPQTFERQPSSPTIEQVKRVRIYHN